MRHILEICRTVIRKDASSKPRPREEWGQNVYLPQAGSSIPQDLQFTRPLRRHCSEMNGAFLESSRDDSTNSLDDPMRAQSYKYALEDRVYDETHGRLTKIAPTQYTFRKYHNFLTEYAHSLWILKTNFEL